ncbi:glycosyltransferase [Vibrio fluvialis]
MRDLIVFGEDFGGLPSSTQHLIKRLADDRQVLWVNSIGLRQPKFTTKDLSRVWHKLCKPMRRPAAKSLQSQSMAECYAASVHSNITQVDLLTLPAPSSQLARDVARRMMLMQLKPRIEQLGLNRPILWSSLPTAADLCHHIDHSGVVYYCGDDFASLAGVDHDVVCRHEQSLVENANLILVASDQLKHKFPARKTHLLPHGVDSELFTKPTPRAVDLPVGKGPIAGFYGSLSDWIDYDLIDYSAQALPDWNFVFIGPQCVDAQRLPQHANIHYLGSRPHHMLPAYSQHWDVSMLPFLRNSQIDACNPLKLLEYLAAGQPIVSVDFPALSLFRRYLHTAVTPDDFVHALQAAQTDERISPTAISGHSWNDRSLFLNWMLELL